MRAAMAIQLKEEMGTAQILKREHQIIDKLWTAMKAMPDVEILAPQHKDRLGVISFNIRGPSLLGRRQNVK